MTHQEKQDQIFQYAVKLYGAIAQVFEEDNDFHIPQEDLNDDQKFTMFMHALATVVPNRIFNELTNSGLNNMEFNHAANSLVFQYCTVSTD